MRRSSAFLLACLLDVPASSWAQAIFPPSGTPRTIQSTQTTAPIVIDGRLNEPDWQLAVLQGQFRQVEPNQGDSATFDTDVRVLYDEQHLYISAFCHDTLGVRGTRVPDLRRDFDYFANDLFGISIDAFRDQRNAVAFQTNPYGVQRDLLSFDDSFVDREWDALWKVRTSITDSGWVAEIAIPWSTLRYPNSSSQSWGINFYRNIRRINELSAWSPFPRAFTPYRMNYEGVLESVNPPPPATNLRIQPYLLAMANQARQNEVQTEEKAKLKFGGEAKWAINSNSVLDLTVNTDFAQADADRQVNNLSRFSVFFPERRQFFLENASLFSPGLSSNLIIQPFFSRRIGLDNGNTVPIDAGARYVNRTAKKALGALLMRQRGGDDQPASTFAVARYTQNVGGQNRVGALLTGRYDDAVDSLGARQNMVGSVDGFYRISAPLSLTYLVSGSVTHPGKAANAGNSQGVAAYAQFNYQANWLSAYYTQALVTQDYNPEVGFVSRSNVIQTSPGFYLNYRPKWKPKFVRSFEPGIFVDLYHTASNGTFLESQLTIFPIWVRFQNGAVLDISYIPSQQYLTEAFMPLGVAIQPGYYAYQRLKGMFTSDQSKKIAYSLTYETGGYYDGTLESLILSGRISPIPHIYLLMEYTRNQLSGVGNLEKDKVTHLLTPQVRLALNPRVQLMGYYQKNTVDDRSLWNVRFSWEFKPLSFIYLVYNSHTYQDTDRFSSQQVIGKVTYLKQF